MSHDWKAQRAETFETFAEMAGEVSLPKTAVVYYQFYAENIDPDWAAVEKALKAKGFKTERDEEEGLIVASIGPIPVTPDSIWEQEKIATEAVLDAEFFPDGWEMTTEE
jgi:hypothetical protein